MAENARPTQFAVLGLGRFGLSLVQALAQHNVHILACDKNEERLHEAAEYATHVVQADVADEEAMRRLGLGNFDVVVLAMGEDFEGSLLGLMMAKELGAGCIVVKAAGLRQKKIFESLGASRVILPELEMGVKVAQQLMSPNVLDMLEDNDRIQVSEMRPLPEWVGKTVAEANIRHTHGLTLLAILRGQNTILPVLPGEMLNEDDILITLAQR